MPRLGEATSKNVSDYLAWSSLCLSPRWRHHCPVQKGHRTDSTSFSLTSFILPTLYKEFFPFN
jgi:hypothetical protein